VALPNIPVHNFLMWQSGIINGAVIAVFIHYYHILNYGLQSLTQISPEGDDNEKVAETRDY
jgi:hypothetical protein